MAIKIRELKHLLAECEMAIEEALARADSEPAVDTTWIVEPLRKCHSANGGILEQLLEESRLAGETDCLEKMTNWVEMALNAAKEDRDKA